MESADDGNWDLIVAKIISGSCLFVVSVICGVIPFKLAKIFKWVEPLDQTGGQSKDKKSSKTVSILLCFGGGVLLATTFLHLLPEINHTIVWLIGEGMIPEMNLNLGELLMMVGFFLIYLIEEIVHNYLHRHQQKTKALKDKNENESSIDFGDAFIRGLSVRNSAVLNGSYNQNSVTDLIPTAVDDSEKQSKGHHEDHGHGHSHMIPLHDDEEDVLVSSLRGLLISTLR